MCATAIGMRSIMLVALVLVSACREGPSARRLVDGGRFELPDSGQILDARAQVGPPDSGPGDSGPFVCEGGCPDGSVCGCLDDNARTCGCTQPAGFNEPCDPQHLETCRWPFECVRGRKLEGLRYVCSDGRAGSSCSSVDSICNTSRGCVCVQTPFGTTACSCQGEQGANPVLCDPQTPASCPGGTCVRIETPSGVTHLCSQGMRYQPCSEGDSTCRTSLGCTCPIYLGRASCQCAEPGEVDGELCDPRVPGACVAPLECGVVPGDLPAEFDTRCVSSEGGDGGVAPLDCDPARPFCPTGFTCREVRPSTYRCVID